MTLGVLLLFAQRAATLANVFLWGNLNFCTLIPHGSWGLTLHLVQWANQARHEVNWRQVI